MSSPSSPWPLAAVVGVICAALAGGGVYYYVTQSGHSSGAAGSAPADALLAITPAPSDVVLAKVNDSPIYKSEVDAFIADLPEQVRQQMPESELTPRVVDQLISFKLADTKALEQQLDHDPAVTARMHISAMNVLSETYLERTAKAQINDAVLKAKYDDLVKQTTPPQEVHARHILVKSEAEAKDIIKQLDQGGDFAKLAKDKSTDPGSGESGGDLGYFTKDKMVPEFAEVAFKMNKGEYTKTPVHTQYGWHVIQVLDKRDQPLPSFDQVKPRLVEVVLRDEESKVLAGLKTSAKIERFNPDGSPIVAQAPAPATPAPAQATPAAAQATPAAAQAAPAAAPAAPATAAPAAAAPAQVPAAPVAAAPAKPAATPPAAK